MSADNIPDRLAQAGVDDGALGAAETLAFPVATVDEARAPLREAPSLTGFGEPRDAAREAPLAVRSEVLAAIGLSATLDRAANRLAFAAPADLAFTIDPPPSAEGLRVDTPSEFLIATPDAGPLALGFVRTGGLRLQGLHAWPAPPLDAWAEAAGEAEWLLLAGEDGIDESGLTRWTATLIAGRVARLLAPSDGSPLIGARQWSRSLTAGHRGRIERFATVAARQLATRLDRLQATIVPDEPGLTARWRALCHERDDLDGVRILLREARTGEALAGALAEADAIGRALRFSWPSDVDVHDARLQRVAEGDPGAWWASTRGPAFVL
jgi:hypothetical protein